MEKFDTSCEFIKSQWIWIVIICLASSVVSILYIPSYVSQAFTADIIDKELSLYFGGQVSISSKEIISGIVWMLQSTTISSFLLIIAYIFKYWIDKRIFSIKRWRDWKFLLFASVVPIILMDLIRKIDLFANLNFSSNFIVNFFLTLLSGLVLVFICSFIIEKEKEPIVIDPKKIEEDLMKN